MLLITAAAPCSYSTSSRTYSRRLRVGPGVESDRVLRISKPFGHAIFGLEAVRVVLLEALVGLGLGAPAGRVHLAVR